MSSSSEGITVLYFAAAHTETGLFSETIPLLDIPNDPISASSTTFSPLSASIDQSTTASAMQSDKATNGIPTGPSLIDLGQVLISRYPDTKLASVLAMSAWSVNEEMVPDQESGNAILKAGDVVAIIPPVSGG